MVRRKYWLKKVKETKEIKDVVIFNIYCLG